MIFSGCSHPGGSAPTDAALCATPDPREVYLKPSNQGTHFLFGVALAISADGLVLAVGADGEASTAVGINPTPGDQSATNAGAVYIFEYVSAEWKQTAYIKASNTSAQAGFGVSVALSADGNELAVGATGESSAATGVNGDQTDHSAPNAGAAYVFERSGGTWAQTAYLKASNATAGAYFGELGLSADGSLLVVGSASTHPLSLAGNSYVFRRIGASWTQEAYLDQQQFSRAVSADGTTFVAGDWNSQVVNLYVRGATTWSSAAQIVSPINHPIGFGVDAALSMDGMVAAFGAPGESSASTGINNGNESDTSAPYSGAAYLYAGNGATLTRTTYFKASNARVGGVFGARIAMTPDGTALAITANDDQSIGPGVDGVQAADGISKDAGAVYMFRNSGAWLQSAFVKAPVPSSYSFFGSAIALSADGHTLAVGAFGDDGAATGVGGDECDHSAPGRGAVFVIRDP